MHPDRPRSQEKLGLLYPLLLFVLAATATAIIIDNRTQIVGGSYHIEKLRTRLEDLKIRNKQLQLELSSLKLPSNIEEYATAQRLSLPKPDQILVLPPPPGQRP